MADNALVGIGAEQVFETEPETEVPPVPAPFSIDIRFDQEFETVTTDMTGTWRGTRNGEYVWNDEPIREYFGQLKEKYDTEGDVKFITHNGKTIYIESSCCGWKLNVDFSIQNMKYAVENGDTVMDPAWNSGLVYSALNGVGMSYVEVDIEQQKVFLFVDGKMTYKSDCVTGYPVGDSETQKGVFQVAYKSSPAVLKGENGNGSQYEQPVNYWIPFNGGQGLHDAVWRTDFGGKIYLTHGSHGCVNLPLETAEVIYNAVYKYFPVIVY